MADVPKYPVRRMSQVVTSQKLLFPAKVLVRKL
ncbi:hypothetical protein ANCCAN_26757 [Ancylostoma caninum]|uniref:Uncharacterized protein n=1 Tax=Ancylostoma caninum TaxID=29170 RepID=A0A368F7E6_ANCCA|nr:hypothetical protein ANCCAN_26757 [Ancylostoma caninum]